jgi:MarR family transcriptional regulator for hemolysin
MTAKEEAYLEPMHSLGYLARINFRAFSRALEKLTIAHGVTAGQWRFLRVLWEQDDITQRELSARAGTTEATTVRAVAALSSNGFITRHKGTDDRRKMRVRLTPKGRRLKRTLLPMVISVNEQALKGISASEVEITRRVLARTFANLATQNEEVES